ncbi:MAG TPA: hypothetical protein VFE78_04695, partial [Gemmataceae bacterium]|nr:hypothetical protein [Gemmataceae bacterium]
MTYFSWPWSGKRLLTHSTRAAEAGRLEPLEDRVLLSTYLVTSAADDGSTGTLRWAIGQVNGGPGGDLIDFQIGVFASAQTITLSSSLGPLPAVSKAATIDGLSQGAGQNGKLTVEINGSAVTGDGLTVTAGGVTLDGLAIANFSGNGVVLNNPAGSAGDTVIGDFVGTDYTGTAAAGNGGDG